jgi:hypothetical protein
MDTNKAKKLMVHLVFGGGLTLILLVSVISKVASGERVPLAIWNSLRETRPFEWVMILLFWWIAASQRVKGQWWPNR